MMGSDASFAALVEAADLAYNTMLQEECTNVSLSSASANGTSLRTTTQLHEQKDPRNQFHHDTATQQTLSLESYCSSDFLFDDNDDKEEPSPLASMRSSAVPTPSALRDNRNPQPMNHKRIPTASSSKAEQRKRKRCPSLSPTPPRYTALRPDWKEPTLALELCNPTEYDNDFKPVVSSWIDRYLNVDGTCTEAGNEDSDLTPSSMRQA